MFDQLVVSGEQGRRPISLGRCAVSAVVQVVILVVLILIPLIYTEALPKGMLNTFLVAPAPPPPPPPPRRIVKIVKRAEDYQHAEDGGAHGHSQEHRDRQGRSARDLYQQRRGVAGGTRQRSWRYSRHGPAGPPPPPKPAAPRVSASEATWKRAMSPIKSARSIRAIAKTAHVSGTVVLHAIIAKDGTIQELQYVSGPPLLMKSAMDAVKRMAL